MDTNNHHQRVDLVGLDRILKKNKREQHNIEHFAQMYHVLYQGLLWILGSSQNAFSMRLQDPSLTLQEILRELSKDKKKVATYQTRIRQVILTLKKLGLIHEYNNLDEEEMKAEDNLEAESKEN